LIKTHHIRFAGNLAFTHDFRGEDNLGAQEVFVMISRWDGACRKRMQFHKDCNNNHNIITEILERYKAVDWRRLDLQSCKMLFGTIAWNMSSCSIPQEGHLWLRICHEYIIQGKETNSRIGSSASLRSSPS
jgi:hypothetical protein